MNSYVIVLLPNSFHGTLTRLKLPIDAVNYLDKPGFDWRWNHLENDAVNFLCDVTLPRSDPRSEPSLCHLLSRNWPV
jgi:hypothetical protein